jgi:hypothetical protein
VTLKWLTIRNGLASGDYPDNSGGGIGNEGTLVLKRVSVRGNSAYNGGGISNRGTLTLNGHTVIKHNHAPNDGGGVDVDSTGGPAAMTMNGASRIRRNTAGWGGGVNVYVGSLTMNDTSSIYRNTATTTGGGVAGYCATLTGVVGGGNVHDNSPGDVSNGC